jgi:hypothetical protein
MPRPAKCLPASGAVATFLWGYHAALALGC